MAPMNVREIENTLVLEVSAILSKAQPDVLVDTPLHDQGMDSLRFVELLVTIEKMFKVKLLDEGITQDDIKTIRSLAICIGRVI